MSANADIWFPTLFLVKMAVRKNSGCHNYKRKKEMCQDPNNVDSPPNRMCASNSAAYATNQPVTVAARSKARTDFAPSNTEIEDSRYRSLCPFVVFLLSCVHVAAFQRAEGVLPNVYRIKKLKKKLASAVQLATRSPH